MKRLFILIPVLWSLAACGDGPVYTWGDASRSVADSFCEAQQRCALFEVEDEDVDRCKRQSEWNLCGLNETCDSGLPEGAAETVQECLDAIDQLADNTTDACFNLVYFGVVPDVCAGFFDLNPNQ